MPNAEGFIVDDRPATEYSQWSVYTNEACMTNCKDSVEITMRAAVLDVTPKETQARRIQEMVEQTNTNAPSAAMETQTAEAVPATEALAGFLANPKGYAPGTKMSFAGLKKESDVAAVIEYLKAEGQ